MKIKTLMLLLVIPLFFSIASIADTVDIREWLIPWEKSEPTDVFVDSRGRIWFVAFGGSYIANFSPGTEDFNRYDLRKGTAPSALLVDDDGHLVRQQCTPPYWIAESRYRTNHGTGDARPKSEGSSFPHFRSERQHLVYVGGWKFCWPAKNQRRRDRPDPDTHKRSRPFGITIILFKSHG